MINLNKYIYFCIYIFIFEISKKLYGIKLKEYYYLGINGLEKKIYL